MLIHEEFSFLDRLNLSRIIGSSLSEIMNTTMALDQQTNPVNFREGITECSNEVYNEFTNICQHNNYLFDYTGYMLTAP